MGQPVDGGGEQLGAPGGGAAGICGREAVTRRLVRCWPREQVLDIFVDAKQRGVRYGYRQAGKDWIGRNKGLWTFHAK